MQMHIGARNGQVVIRAQLDDDTFEFLPNEIFADDLPSHFKNHHYHWLNLKTKAIEFRPFDNRWQSSAKNWVLHFASIGGPLLQLGRNKLLNRSSCAHTFLVNALRSIETEDYIHVQCDDDGRAEAFLPRYKLHFALDNSGNILSRQLQAQVDPDQTLGTLVGFARWLENKACSTRSEHAEPGVSASCSHSFWRSGDRRQWPAY